MSELLDRLEAATGHRFADEALAQRAVTHSSYANERGDADNERLEFLGDSILNTCTTLLLWERFPSADPSALSSLRSRLVNADTLAEVGSSLGLGPMLRLGRGEDAGGGREKINVLADATEAVLGALFLETDLETCRQAVRGWLGERVDTLAARAATEDRWKHVKARFQERVQRVHADPPDYVVELTEGPPHLPTFHVAVFVAGERLGAGTGRTKKDAEKAAAVVALAALEAREAEEAASDAPEAS